MPRAVVRNVTIDYNVVVSHSVGFQYEDVVLTDLGPGQTPHAERRWNKDDGDGERLSEIDS